MSTRLVNLVADAADPAASARWWAAALGWELRPLRNHYDMDSHSASLLTTGQVARALSTTVPRVLRAVRGGGVPTVRRGNRVLLDEAAVEQLRRRWGVAPAIPGLTREDVLALAALGRRPFGVGSARAVLGWLG